MVMQPGEQKDTFSFSRTSQTEGQAPSKREFQRWVDLPAAYNEYN